MFKCSTKCNYLLTLFIRNEEENARNNEEISGIE